MLAPGDMGVPYNVGLLIFPRASKEESAENKSQSCVITHVTTCDLCCILLIKRVRPSSDKPMEEAEVGESQMRVPGD